MPDLSITIPEQTIIIHDAHIAPGRPCTPDCDCPVVLARTQQAIDTARAQDGRPARPLSERLYAMQYATPDTAWFVAASADAAALERATPGDTTPSTPMPAIFQPAEYPSLHLAADLAPRDRIAAMHLVVRDTVLDLERADLIPTDHEYTFVSGMQECHVYTGNLRFIVGMTGMVDTPANCFVVTTSCDDCDDCDGVPGTERFADDLDTVRAWLLAWAAGAAYQATIRPA